MPVTTRNDDPNGNISCIHVTETASCAVSGDCERVTGSIFRTKRDVVLCYRPMPFGRRGSPAFFASFGGAIARIHRSSGERIGPHGFPDTRPRLAYILTTAFLLN